MPIGVGKNVACYILLWYLQAIDVCHFYLLTIGAYSISTHYVFMDPYFVNTCIWDTPETINLKRCQIVIFQDMFKFRVLMMESTIPNSLNRVAHIFEYCRQFAKNQMMITIISK